MERLDFLNISALTMIGLSLPLSSLAMPQSQFSKEDLMGKSNPKLLGEGYKLRKKAFLAFSKMKAEAEKRGFKIKVVSSYRNYDRQHQIWERKYTRYTSAGLSPSKSINKIIEYSTIPGTSRHHWGTDIDIIDGSAPKQRDPLLAKHFEMGGPYYRFKQWLDEYANSFGFYLVYTNKPGRKGFKYEPWHYSYAPLSIPMLKAYRKLQIDKELKFTKLMGSDYFTDDFINKYVSCNILDINPELL
ncbi:M15 family metallopeptidase [Aquimarina pacifica]|uniref:M15 family metallopeptidase n=1 Tax=Aquimarina pacifica TaxID=1296415 RepID=UPI00047046AA|nr:M15 family metallopeptidase [Aquimarina pacifica]